MKLFKSIIPILGVFLIILSCSKNVNPEPVKIGIQTWAAKNLEEVPSEMVIQFLRLKQTRIG